KTYGIGVDPSGNNLIYTIKSTSTNEEDILSINFYQLLLGVFSSALRGHQNISSFQKFQQALLNTFSAHIAGNGGIIAFSGNLINFINVNDTSFGSAYIVIAHLQQPGKNAFHVFPHIPRFGKYRSIHNGKRHV